MIVKNSEVDLQELEEKVARKILACDGSLMMVEVHFEKGGVGKVHSHQDHEQVCYVAQGGFEVTVGDEKKTLYQGDSFYAAKNVDHGVLAIEDGILIDVFNPIREDFLE